MNEAEREHVGDLISEYVMAIENLGAEVLEILAGPDTPERYRLIVERENIDHECRQWDRAIAKIEMAGSKAPAIL